MKEIVIISGKGGTGKTSVTAALASIAEKAVFADCDVDAADLHLIFSPEIIKRERFLSGNTAEIINEECTSCGVCQNHCRFDAIYLHNQNYVINPAFCEGCGVCSYVCPAQAIRLNQRDCGEWFVSKTRFGTLVHAKLGIGAENSGKLVSLVRKEARELAKKENIELIIIDGPPGIGCAVISSITNSNAVIVVTEPTLSGINDLERVLSLTNHFKIKTFVIVNKYDINYEMSKIIEEKAISAGAKILPFLPFDKDFTKAQIEGKNIVEYGSEILTNKLKTIWRQLWENM